MTTNLIDLEARFTELRDDAKQIEADIQATLPAAPPHSFPLAIALGSAAVGAGVMVIAFQFF